MVVMLMKNICFIVAALVLFISLGSAQINVSTLGTSIINLTPSSSDFMNETEEMVKNFSLKVPNSTYIHTLRNISREVLNSSKMINDNSTPEIKLEEGVTDGYIDLSGYIFDCTFILNNTGYADGIAIINFLEDGKILREKASFFVPARTAQKFNEKITLPHTKFFSLEDANITFYIERQRKPENNIEDIIGFNIRKN